jgi:hypothetical protein
MAGCLPPSLLQEQAPHLERESRRRVEWGDKDQLWNIHELDDYKGACMNTLRLAFVVVVLHIQACLSGLGKAFGMAYPLCISKAYMLHTPMPRCSDTPTLPNRK